jgi:WD40 repeat protein
VCGDHADDLVKEATDLKSRSSRVEIADVWKGIRGSLTKSSNNALDPDDVLASEKSFQCLLLGKLSSMFVKSGAVKSDGKMRSSQGSDKICSEQNGTSNGCTNNGAIDFSGIDDPQSGEMFKSSTLLAHHDCVTGLAIGGRFLFSCSYDKTVNLWSLKDLSHVQYLKGQEFQIIQTF